MLSLVLKSKVIAAVYKQKEENLQKCPSIEPRLYVLNANALSNQLHHWCIHNREEWISSEVFSVTQNRVERKLKRHR